MINSQPKIKAGIINNYFSRGEKNEKSKYFGFACHYLGKYYSSISYG